MVKVFIAGEATMIMELHVLDNYRRNRDDAVMDNYFKAQELTRVLELHGLWEWCSNRVLS